MTASTMTAMDWTDADDTDDCPHVSPSALTQNCDAVDDDCSGTPMMDMYQHQRAVVLVYAQLQGR